MLVDDGNVFDDELFPAHRPAPKLRAQARLAVAARSSLERLRAFAEEEPPPERRVRRPEAPAPERAPRGLHARKYGHTMSDGARVEMIERIHAEAPDAVLDVLRESARQPGTTGIAAWRAQVDREKRRTEALELIKTNQLEGQAADELLSAIMGPADRAAKRSQAPPQRAPPGGGFPVLEPLAQSSSPAVPSATAEVTAARSERRPSGASSSLPFGSRRPSCGE